MTLPVRSVDMGRLLRPTSIAVLGGSWAHSVVQQCQRMGFDGHIWPVHPSLTEVSGLPCYATLAELPASPDAAFIGINRFLTISAVQELSALGAGGVVCFASGYGEAVNEDKDAAELQRQLLAAAADMPLIGPNCYGMINYLDGALLWPDQHGGERVHRGVALIAQSSNIAINLTMQRRSLPIAYVLTAGNQAQLSLGQLGASIIEDERVTALALHIEGFGDIAAFERMAVRARELGKPIIVLKVGRSHQAQHAMVSHTNSLSGQDSAAAAFLHRLGIARVFSLTAMIETLKLLHTIGPLAGNAIHSMSCSGGEASLMADAAMQYRLQYPALSTVQSDALRAALGPLVALANPLDYHTFIWDDLGAMTATFTAMLQGQADLSLLVIDFPRADRCEFPSWRKAIEALLAARDATGAATAVVATLPENLPEQIAKELIGRGIAPLCGIEDALAAVELAHFLGRSHLSEDQSSTALQATLQLLPLQAEVVVLDEAQAKARLSEYGVRIPQARIVELAQDLPDALTQLRFPVVLKGRGLAHKTEANAVVLNLVNSDEVCRAAAQMSEIDTGFLLEEYIEGVVAELLISIVRDATHGFQLTLAAGGTLTELMADSTHLLLPCYRADVLSALSTLKIYRVLKGYRGQQGAAINKIVDTVMAIQDFALTYSANLSELEINPVLCTSSDAIVADALISLAGE